MVREILETTKRRAPDSGPSIVIVGMGETGQSVLRHLDGKGMEITVMDSRRRPSSLDRLKSLYPGARFITGGFEQEVLMQAGTIVLSPGVPVETGEIDRARKSGVEVIGDIELFAREATQKVIGVTGSNGKSTVAALTRELLVEAGTEAAVGGNIGVPALDLLTESASVVVLELSSFQLETTFSLKPEAAVILNVSPDHLDRHRTLENYTMAKRRIYKGARAIIFNREDERTFPGPGAVGRAFSFGLDAPGDHTEFGVTEYRGKSWLSLGSRRLFAVEKMKLGGRHNLQNALAALALTHAAGADLDNAVKGLATFGGLPHRFEYVGTWDGVDWINDSKGTNPGATLAAISGQTRPIVLMMGGDSKGADFSILGDAIRRHVKAIVLFGRDADILEQVVPRTVPCLHAHDLSQAVQIADEFSSPADMVVFSPACASFDMYRNYMQRGESFKQSVREHFQ